jgi:hypothetical protein
LQGRCTLAGTPDCQAANTSPFTGAGYMIFIIIFPGKDERWAARIPLDQEDSFLETCVKPLQLAHMAPHIAAPRIHGYFDCGSSDNNPVGVGYMLLD